MTTAALLGVAIAVVLVWPLAYKWQLPFGIVIPWTIVLGAAAGLGWQAALGSLSAWWLLACAVTVVAVSGGAAAFMFFRDPERTAPDTPGALVSPADGEIIYVRPFKGGEVPPVEKRGRSLHLAELAQIDVCDEGYLIGISMHLLNVHVNRAPMPGSIVSLLHIPGQFMSLKRPEAMTANERMTTVIEQDGIRIGVVQIASRLVRRIVSYLKEGERVAAGQRIGMIRFGSQVDVIVPRVEGLRLSVKVGDNVRAGTSVLGVIADSHGEALAEFEDVRRSVPEGTRGDWAERGLAAPCEE